VIRAIVCDLDGTLVRPDNVVLPKDVEMLRAARDRGVRITLITGRPPRCLSDLPADLWRIFTQIFTSNGASSFLDGKLDIIAPVDVNQGLAFAAMLREADPTVAFAAEFDTTFGYEPKYAYWPATDADPGATCAEVGELLRLGNPVTKLLCRSGRFDAGELARTAEAVDPGVTITYSCRPGENGPVGVLAPCASKGRAAHRDLRRARIDPQTAVAFGDRHNDVSMLMMVGLGIVIGEGVDPVLEGFESTTSVGRWLTENQGSWRGAMATNEVNF
jgi:HAD superfamily hydrolase (TIGR01484 family)